MNEIDIVLSFINDTFRYIRMVIFPKYYLIRKTEVQDGDSLFIVKYSESLLKYCQESPEKFSTYAEIVKILKQPLKTNFLIRTYENGKLIFFSSSDVIFSSYRFKKVIEQGMLEML